MRLGPAELDAFARALEEGCSAVGVRVAPSVAGKMFEHFGLVLEWNERCGLTAVTDVEEAAVKHYVDSLSCAVVLKAKQGGWIGDVGSGGGFPGVVLALQGLGKAVLIESSQKKAEFLGMCVRRLGVKAVVVGERAEDVARGSLREALDMVVSRAVGCLGGVLEVSAPLVKCGGLVVAMRGPRGSAEAESCIGAAMKLGLERRSALEYELPRGYGRRVVLVYEKVHSTGMEFPRRAGIPFKRPLCV